MAESKALAHVLGLLGWAASEGRGFHPPYWWGYLILYPAAASARRQSSISWHLAWSRGTGLPATAHYGEASLH